MIKILGPIDIQPLLDCYSDLESGIQWTEYGHKGRQAGLQHRPSENPWTSIVGKSSGDEMSAGIINPYFKETVFEEIINQYNLKKTRLMWIYPYACYSIHRDETQRIHIPLITNEECYFLFKYGSPKHLKSGTVYQVDTKLEHTFINCSDQPRLHLVGAINV